MGHVDLVSRDKEWWIGQSPGLLTTGAGHFYAVVRSSLVASGLAQGSANVGEREHAKRE